MCLAGLVAASEGPALGRQVPLALSVSCRPADAGAEAAVAAAGPAQPLVCALEVEPSTAPAAIVLLHDGQQLPQRELVGHPINLCCTVSFTILLLLQLYLLSLLSYIPVLRIRYVKQHQSNRLNQIRERETEREGKREGEREGDSIIQAHSGLIECPTISQPVTARKL